MHDVARLCYTFNMETKTQTVRARISPSLKKKAEKVLSEIGISPAEAINVFYTRIAREKQIPFSLHVPNATTRKAIAEARAGRLKKYDSVDEMFESILGKNWRKAL